MLTFPKFQEIFSGLMQKVSTFGVALQNSYGTKEGDERQAVLVADWTSAEDKDVFATSRSSQSCVCLIWWCYYS
jgi:hypothetical protein